MRGFEAGLDAEGFDLVWAVDGVPLDVDVGGCDCGEGREVGGGEGCELVGGDFCASVAAEEAVVEEEADFGDGEVAGDDERA